MLSCNHIALNIYNLNNRKRHDTKRYINNISPLEKDTVSFGALKKSKFSGIDLVVVNKFKAPIEKFNTNEDFQNWCKEKIVKIKNKLYEGRRASIIRQRNFMLKEWFDYFKDNENIYNNAVCLLVLDSITKNLNSKNDELPFTLNEKILTQTIKEIESNVNQNSRFEVNFSNLYKINLKKFLLNIYNEEKIKTKTGWIIIPSKKNDPEHFDENIEKMKILSHNNWCTKNLYVRKFLEDKDFYIYYENGEPKIGILSEGGVIVEIQGINNNSEIPLNYLNLVYDYVKDKKLNETTKTQLENAFNRKKNVEEYIKKHFPNGIENLSIEDILRGTGINVEKDEKGFLIISEYKQPEYNISFDDLGLNENILVQKIKTIKGDAEFYGSNLRNLGNIEYIGGNVNFRGSYVINLKNLKIIMGSAKFKDSIVVDIGKLQTIGGNANFENSKITDFKNLKTINGKCYVNSVCEEIIEKLKERNFDVVIVPNKWDFD